jgi:hypothetical protein
MIETAAVILAVGSLVAVLVLVRTVVRLRRSVTDLTSTVEGLRSELTDDLVAVAPVARPRVSYLPVSNSVVKTMALASGAGEAVRSFRSRNGRG